MAAHSIDPYSGHEADPCVKARNADRVGSSGFIFVREKIGLHLELGPAARAPVYERADRMLESAADDEPPGSLGAVQALVAGKGEQIDVHGFDIDGNGPGGLGCVHAQGNTPFAGDRRDLGDRHDGAGHVGCMGDHDEPGIRPDERDDISGIELAAAGAGGHAEVRSAGPGGVQRPHHRVVLHPGDHRVTAFSKQTGDHYVERFCGVFREYDSENVRDSEEFGHSLTRVDEHPPRVHGARMPGSPRAGPDETVVFHHGFHHTGRLGP